MNDDDRDDLEEIAWKRSQWSQALRATFTAAFAAADTNGALPCSACGARYIGTVQDHMDYCPGTGEEDT